MANAAGTLAEAPGISADLHPLPTDYLSALGLVPPPFEQGGPFFAEHGRQALLAQLLHLLHFSDEPTLLVGPAGSGKSTLLAVLREQLSDMDYVYLAGADDLPSARQLLSDLAQTIGLSVTAEDELADLQARLAEWTEFSAGGLQVYLLIDDVHGLKDEVLACLLALIRPAVEGGCWHLLAVGEPQAADYFARYQPAGAEALQQFSMPSVGPEFVADYLAFRLAAAGYDGSPLFDEDEELQLAAASGGDLTTLHQLAEVSLLGKVEEARRSSSHPSNLPWLHLGAVAVLAVVLGLAWLVQDPQPDQKVVALSLPASGAGAAAAPVLEPEPEPTAPVSSQVPPSNPAVPVFKQETTTGLSTFNAPATRPVGSPAPVALAVPAISGETPAAPPGQDASRDDPLMSTGGLPARAATSPLSEDERFLNGLAPSRFVLQVLAAESEAGLRKLAVAHPDLQLRLYRARREGQDWFVLVHGNFASAQAARAATQKLPKALQKSGPWPRSLASVQQQIEEARAAAQ